MKASYSKLQVAMARACMDTKELTRITVMPRQTVNNVITGRNGLGIGVFETRVDTFEGYKGDLALFATILPSRPKPEHILLYKGI